MTRADDGTLSLEHQKSNLGKLCEPLALQWPDGGLPQLVAAGGAGEGGNPLSPFMERLEGREQDARAFKLLAMVAEFESREQYCSPIATARNNVHAMLKSEPSYQRLKLTADSCKRIVNQCQRAGWIESMEYRTHDRKTRPRWTLTPTGRAIAGLPAVIAPCAPCAPCTTERAESAQSAGGAPCAPSCVGGVGEESAHLGAKESTTPGADGVETLENEKVDHAEI